MEAEFDYDIFVIGGGSGGISCARNSVKYGKKVALADFVKPSPAGSKYGLGGTCVNVGCIPKKLMHYSAMLGENSHHMKYSGWNVNKSDLKHDWPTLVKKIQLHIKKLNFGYRSDIVKLGIEYFNSLAKVTGKNSVQLTDAAGTVTTKTAKNIVIAVGGRPSIPPQLAPGSSYLLTSDDLFSQRKDPGKTLVIGSSYVGLECAGFLAGLGKDTTLMVRSILLRGFDQDMANRIGRFMEDHQLKFLKQYVPLSTEKLENGQIKVKYHKTDDKEAIEEDTFDTVLLAIGRTPDTKGLGVEELGMKLDKGGKIIVGDDEKTSIDSIYALGDCTSGRLELTPPAIMAGELLAARLFGGSTQLMDYINIATTVFTPIEYGAIGYSEEDAIKIFGDDNIQVFHSHFTPLEWNYDPNVVSNYCYGKLIVNKADNERVVGFHYLGPNAGEVTQGFSVAMRLKATKSDFLHTVGIHPTVAEEMTDLKKNKKDDPVAEKTGC